MNLRDVDAVLLISCYELGHQPLGIAYPLGFLKRAGFQPAALDVAVESFDPQLARGARFIGISVPMHTAVRLGVRVIERIGEVHPDCHICCYGLYASLNASYLLDHGADSCIGGEYETPLLNLVASVESGSTSAVAGVVRPGQDARPYLKRLPFAIPSRNRLPGLERYARLERDGALYIAGYTAASRGCLHRCTHCPIPPVYGGGGGVFFAVPIEIVLADIRQQVDAGATHITFGDSDFLNGPGHALRVADALHAEFPALTFDVTAKVEHLLKHSDELPSFARSGCLFIVTGVESLNDRSTTAQRPLNDRSTTAQRPLNDRSTTAQRPLNDRSTTAQRPLNDRSTTAQRPLNDRSTDRSTTAQRPLNDRSTTMSWEFWTRDTPARMRSRRSSGFAPWHRAAADVGFLYPLDDARGFPTDAGLDRNAGVDRSRRSAAVHDPAVGSPGILVGGSSGLSAASG